MKKYLFRNNHNGFYSTYQPFEVSQSLTQDYAEKLILEICPYAWRTGGVLEHLLEGLDKKNIKFKQYKSVYTKENENEKDIGCDPLPDSMYSWDVIEGISGNY